MKLWPFSKKDETPLAAQPANPQSRKMDLPPGVMLADPSELDFQPGQTRPAGSESSRETAHPVAEETETSQPQPPSFEDLAYIPSPEAAQPQDTSLPTEPAKPDLNEFFDQHQLEMISQATPPQASTPLAPPEPISLAPLPDVEPAPQAAFDAVEPKIPEPNPASSQSGSEAGSNRFDFPTTGLPAVPAERLEQPPADHLDFFNPIGFENNPANDLFSDFMAPPPQEATTVAQDAAFINDFSEIPPQAVIPPEVEHSVIPSNFTEAAIQPIEHLETAPVQPTAQEPGSFFLHPAGSELHFPQTEGIFDAPNELESTTLAEQAMSEMTEYAQPADFQFTTEDAFLPGAPLEIPPQLNLPDEALMPNANDHFFETTAIPPVLEDAYPGEAFEDDSFDLDSLLLGRQPEEQSSNNPLEAMEFEAQDLNPSETAPFLDYSKNFMPETLDEGPNHYFGDEAEGLKGIDNTDSYDFGHYEDPDEPVPAFVLDNDPESNKDEPISASEAEPPVILTEGMTFNDGYTEPETGFSFSDAELDMAALFQPEALPETQDEPFPAADEAPSYISMPSLPSRSEFMQGLQHPVTPGYQASAEPVEVEAAEAPETPEPQVASKEPEPEQVQKEEEPAPAMAAKPTPKKRPPLKPLVQPKPYRESLADRIGSFEQEVLLKNSQFLSQSIDHLVNSYFEQQDQEAS